MIEYPTEEWIERLGRVFGRFRNKSIVLRGDGTRIHRNQYEVALAHIHLMTKKLYRENKIGTYYTQQKHLVDQERTLWLLAQDFQVSRDKVLGPGHYYDFIARPVEGTGSYDLGLADLLFISTPGEIPLILDFQYYNNVIIENYSSVRFIQGLNFYVKFYLKTRFPIPQNDKIERVEKWLYEKVRKFDKEEQRQFHWYELEYKEPDVIASNTYEKPPEAVKASATTVTTVGTAETIYDIHPKKRWNYLCSESALLKYFDLLKQPNPNNGEPLLDENSIDWIVGYYFGSEEYTLENKPEIIPNLSRKDLQFFIFQFSLRVSPKHNTSGGVKQIETVQILCDCFPEMFSGKPKGVSDHIASVSAKHDSNVKKLLDLSNHPKLNEEIKESLIGI